jgi:hypothetical protein
MFQIPDEKRPKAQVGGDAGSTATSAVHKRHAGKAHCDALPVVVTVTDSFCCLLAQEFWDWEGFCAASPTPCRPGHLWW